MSAHTRCAVCAVCAVCAKCARGARCAHESSGGAGRATAGGPGVPSRTDVGRRVIVVKNTIDQMWQEKGRLCTDF